jgi:hypothetical protein
MHIHHLTFGVAMKSLSSSALDFASTITDVVMATLWPLRFRARQRAARAEDRQQMRRLVGEVAACRSRTHRERGGPQA